MCDTDKWGWLLMLEDIVDHGAHGIPDSPEMHNACGTIEHGAYYPATKGWVWTTKVVDLQSQASQLPLWTMKTVVGVVVVLLKEMFHWQRFQSRSEAQCLSLLPACGSGHVGLSPLSISLPVCMSPCPANDDDRLHCWRCKQVLIKRFILWELPWSWCPLQE